MRRLACLVLVGALGAAPAPMPASLGSPAPVLPLTALNGGPARLPHDPGKVTVLNFWATWCPPCRSETPDLIAAYDALHGSAAFLGIDTTETAPIVKTFVSAKGVPYPIALAGPSVYNAYGIAYIPTTIVLDARGIVRARWVGEMTPARLARYVADARAGRTADDVTPAQARIDALLAPRRFHFDGDPAQRRAEVAAVQHAILRSDALENDSSDGVDYERTQHEQGALLTAAGNAAIAAARTPAQTVAGLTLLARGDGDLNAWDRAARAYRDALALTPDAPQLVGALARAYYRLHDYPAMIEQARRSTRLAPADGDAWSDLGLAYQRARRFADAVPAYTQSLTLLRRTADAEPSQAAIADVADTALDAADVDVSLGDARGARRMFALANAYSDRLRPGGEYATLARNVKERTQEGLVAVALAHRMGGPVVSVIPWTGPDLPGSLASTLKYRVIVAAPAAADVTLRAQGLQPQWIASFCADGLCSPQRVSFKSPATGVKTYEFQLIPPVNGAAPGKVAIAVGGGGVVSLPPSSQDRRSRTNSK